MFREVELPPGVSGRLFLHSMPGRYEPLDKVWFQVKENRVKAIVCLSDISEIREKSHAYASAVESGTVPCAIRPFPVPDYAVPEDREEFWRFAVDVAKQLRSGDAVLVHCGAGIGRTGTFATCVLLALGQPMAEATRAVSKAGSHAEVEPQKKFILWCASRGKAAEPETGHC